MGILHSAVPCSVSPCLHRVFKSHKPFLLPRPSSAPLRYNPRNETSADDWHSTGTPGSDLRPAHVFHNYPGSYTQHPGAAMGATALPPSLHDSMDALAAAPQAHAPPSAAAHHHTSHPSQSSSYSNPRKRGRAASEDAETTAALYGDLPEHKRRKFILVDDAQRATRVRVRVTLDQVALDEMPDSYRKQNSVYPRAYFPMQMQSPGAAPPNPRFITEDTEAGEGKEDEENNGRATVGRTLVPVPLLGEGVGVGREVALPKISRAKRRRETTLNELGYRMSWSQSRVFAGRMLFLQKSRTYLDALASPVTSSGKSVLT